MRHYITTVLMEPQPAEVRYIKEIVTGPEGKGVEIRWTRNPFDAQTFGAEFGVVLGWLRFVVNDNSLVATPEIK